LLQQAFNWREGASSKADFICFLQRSASTLPAMICTTRPRQPAPFGLAGINKLIAYGAIHLTTDGGCPKTNHLPPEWEVTLC
jgi:hypothetical protein